MASEARLVSNKKLHHIFDYYGAGEGEKFLSMLCSEDKHEYDSIFGFKQGSVRFLRI